MKKVLLSIVMSAVMLFVMASCGGASYNLSKCEQLSEKIKNHEDLSDQDYSEMIDQMVGIAKYMKQKNNEFKGDSEKEKEFLESDECKEIVGYAISFGFYLNINKKDLSPEILKKYDQAEKEVEELMKS